MASQTVTRRLQVIIDESGASKTLDRLKVKEQELIDKIKKGEQAGRDMTAELNRLGTVQQQVQQLEGVISGRLTPSLRQTRAAVQNLRRELEGMSQDAPGYAERFQAFQQAGAQLQQMERRVTSFRGAAQSAFSQIKSVALGVTVGGAMQAIGQGFMSLVTNAITGAAKLSDAIADIEKATGLTTRQAEALNSQLSKLDTRTSTSDLRDIAVSLGQAGESATAANVAAIDQINVALGDEFGGDAQQIGNTLSVLRNNLADIKSQNFGDDVSKIGNALNELGANGLATAPVVSDIANRIAGVGQTFGVSSGQILGTAAAFQELGINVERGSTAYTKLLQKMATDTETFAKVAGMGLKEFQELVNTDINEALLRVAKGTKEASNSNTAFAATLSDLESEGAGVSELLAKLATNGDLVRSKIDLASKALTNNSSIMGEFEKKNNTLGAQVDKLGKKLSGAFNSSTLREGAANFVGWLNDITDSGNSANKAFDAQSEKLVQLDKDIDPLLSRYDQLTGKTSLNAAEQEELRKIINDIVNIIPEAISGFDEYGNVIDINREKIGQYVTSNKQFLRELEADAVESLQDDLEGSLDSIAEIQVGINANNYAISQSTGKMADYYRQLNVGYLQKLRESQKKLIDDADVLVKKYGTELPAKVQTMIDAIRQQLNILPTAELADASQFDIANPNAAKKSTDTNIVTKKGRRGKSDADREKERRAKELADLIAEIRKLEQGIYQNANDAYIAALADISFKYQDIIKKNEEKVLDSAQGQMKRRVQLLEDFVSELQNVNRKFAEPAPGPPVDKNPPNTRKAEIDAATNQIAYERRRRESIAKLELEFNRASEKESKEASKENILARLKAEKAYLYEKMVQEIDGATQTGSEIELIKERYRQLGLAKDEEALERLQELQIVKVQQALDYGSQVVGIAQNISSILATIEENRFNEDQQRYNKGKQQYEKMLDQKFLSQKQYDEKIKNLDNQFEAKQKEAARKQFNRNKAISIAEAAMNGAQSITRIWAEVPKGDYGAATLILTALSAATTLAQVTAIAAQKPQYATGGILPDGSSHAEGGIGLRDNRTGSYLGTIEGGEPIISKGVYAANRPLINSLLAKGQSRDFTPITPQWMTRQPMRMNIPLISQSVSANGRARFADGGIAPMADGGQAAAMNNQLLAALLARLNEPIWANVSLNDLQQKTSTKESIRSSGTIS